MEVGLLLRVGEAGAADEGACEGWGWGVVGDDAGEFGEGGFLAFLPVEDAVAVRTVPFGFGVGDDGLGDLRVVASLVPAFVACVAEDDYVSGWTVTS